MSLRGRGAAGWEMGRDSESSAQSKCAGSGETAHLGSSWGKTGCTGGDRGMDSERGVLTGVDRVVGDTAWVYNVVGSETASFWVFWNKPGGWNLF